MLSHAVLRCAGMASIRANAEDEDSEEDADFDMKSEEDDGGEPSDESEAESGDAEVIEEQPKVHPIWHVSLPVETQAAAWLWLVYQKQNDKQMHIHANMCSFTGCAVIGACNQYVK